VVSSLTVREENKFPARIACTESLQGLQVGLEIGECGDLRRILFLFRGQGLDRNSVSAMSWSTTDFQSKADSKAVLRFCMPAMES